MEEFLMSNMKIYIIVWDKVNKKYSYFMENIGMDFSKDTHDVYYIITAKGIIIRDNFCEENRGEKFEEVYNTDCWK